jgi:hypothetical protein
MLILSSLLASTLSFASQPASDPALALPRLALGAATEPAPARVASPLLGDDFPEMEYTYVEANYVYNDSDLVDDKLDGWEVTGSLELPVNFFLQGTVRQLSGDVDLKSYRLGAGWHFGFTKRFDIYGILSYARLESDGSDDDFTDDGPAGEVGLRFMLTHNIELNGRTEWADVGDNDPGVGAGARFYLSDSLSLGARYDTVSGDDTVTAGVRFEF